MYYINSSSCSINSNLSEKTSRDQFPENYGSTPELTINDVELSLTNARTLEVLNICKRKIIRPFNIMLIMVGWRPLSSMIQYPERGKKLCKFCAMFLHSLLVLLLLFSYVYQVLACRFVMNKSDKIIAPTTHHTTMTVKTTPKMGLTRKRVITSEIPLQPACDTYIDCDHILTTYIIPNSMHLIAYIIGFVFYRIGKNEDIYGLMEKTFQYSTTLGSNRSNHTKIRRILILWMVLAVVWVFMSLTTHILYDVTYNTIASPIYIFRMNVTDSPINDHTKQFLASCDLLGYVIMSVVTVVIVLHYSIYCELVKFYVEAISKKIEMRSIKLSNIKNDIHNISIATDLINGTVGRMQSLIFLVYFNLLIVSINMLFNINSQVYDKSWALLVTFRVYFIIHLVPLLSVPLIQCARVNNSIKALKVWSMHMSVFGYRKEKRKDLDSFLLYISNYHYKVNMLLLSVEWRHLQLAFVVICFVFITVLQMGVLDSINFFKVL